MVPNWYLILFLELYQISKTLIFPNKNESDISYRSLQGVLVEHSYNFKQNHKSIRVTSSRYYNYIDNIIISQYSNLNL